MNRLRACVCTRVLPRNMPRFIWSITNCAPKPFTRTGRRQRRRYQRNGKTARPELGSQIEKLRSGWDRANSPVVTAEDIAEVVSMWTGVPLMQVREAESQRLLKMEDELKKSIIGRRKRSPPSHARCAAARAGLKRSKASDWFVHLLGPTALEKQNSPNIG